MGHGFNFLEKLLVYSALGSTTVPALAKDNGIRFRVGQGAASCGVCLLFHVDENYDELFGDHAKRPDYISLYFDGDTCICTIIELKKKSADEALDQIEIMASKLRQEFRKCMPSRLQPYVQGMVVSKPPAMAPKEKINRLHGRGLSVRHHLYTTEPDVTCFISKRFVGTDLFSRSPAVPKCTPRSATKLEDMLRSGAVQTTVLDVDRGIRSGTDMAVAVSYRLTDNESAILYIDSMGSTADIVLAPTALDLREQLRQAVEFAGLERKITVTP